MGPSRFPSNTHTNNSQDLEQRETPSTANYPNVENRYDNVYMHEDEKCRLSLNEHQWQKIKPKQKTRIRQLNAPSPKTHIKKVNEQKLNTKKYDPFTPDEKQFFSLLYEAQKEHTFTETPTMSTAALVTPTKGTNKLDPLLEESYIDFLFSVRDLFDEIRIGTLQKTKAMALYEQVLTHTLTPFDQRTQIMKLSDIKTALRKAKLANDKAIEAFQDKDYRKRELKEDRRLRQYLSTDMKLDKTFTLQALRSLTLSEAQLLLTKHYSSEDLESDDSLLQGEDRIELIIEIYEILHTNYCNNLNKSVLDEDDIMDSDDTKEKSKNKQTETKEDIKMSDPKSNVAETNNEPHEKTTPSKKAKVSFSQNTKHSPNNQTPSEKTPVGETLIGDKVDQEVIEAMSMLLDSEIDMLEKQEIITFLTNFATRNKFTINPTMYMTHDLEKLRQQLKTGARQLQHYFTSIHPTFIAHYSTNAQFAKMSMQTGIDMLTKYAKNHPSQVDIEKIDKLRGIEIIEECKRIRDDLRKLEGLPAINDSNNGHENNDKNQTENKSEKKKNFNRRDSS